MAYWNIGIDESGSFNYKSSQDWSFVCAAITQMSADELESIYAQLYKSQKKHAHKDKRDLLSFFHATEFNAKQKEQIFESQKECVSKVIVSSGRPLVLGNPQHWWVVALMTVLRSVLESDLIKDGDVVDIAVATRSVASTYSERIFASKGGLEYKEWGNYKDDFEKQLKKWVKSINGKKLKLTLVCETAKENVFVVLADQTAGMINLDREKFLGNAKIDTVRCADFNIASNDQFTMFLENDELLLAVQVWLRAFFSKENIPFKLFHSLFDKAFAAKNDYANIWRAALDTCEYALDNRGNEPLLIDRVFKLGPELEKEYARIEGLNSEQRIELGIDIHLLMDIWRVLEKISSHYGDANCKVLEYVDRFWENGNQEIGSTLDRWKFYLQTKLIGAQIPFNGYDFACVANRMEPLLDCQEKFCEQPFPFKNTAVDDELAALLGTYGQAAAFQDDLDEAINCFTEDYDCSSASWKSMPASFMVTVLHRMGDFEKACEWFKKQTGGVSFEDFGKNLSSTSDLWQMVNYFKLLVLAQMQERLVECNIPDLESWNIQNTYPWPLVLKWATFSLLLSGQGERGVELLCKAHNLLQKDGFAIKTLSLPILQMLYCVTEDEGFEKDYKGLLQQLTDTCETFKIYVESHGDAFKLDKDKNLWDAAMILPFNYA